eukprot:TRINITY_DN8929_c0_g1_i10.p5 TRINITY_DN8929_c0_g1~~TRINITY_DN8929_c0_g1_i10.p5  ORF type:complete len:235 (+),score=46.59 TRINITY_DN8929_c0_g1_i10:2476-3180(+)
MSQKQRSYRKRKRLESEPESDPDSRLESTLWLQQQRNKKSGLTDQQLSFGGQGQDSDGEHVYGLQPRASDLLEAYVKEKTVSKTGDCNMEQYVEEEIAKRLGKKRVDVDEGGEAARKEKEHELYQIPENLRGSEMGEVSIPGLNTAITEIQLPMKYKLKNIEATESAKNELLQLSRPTQNKQPLSSKIDVNNFEKKESGFVVEDNPGECKRMDFPLRFGKPQKGEKWSEARVRY